MKISATITTLVGAMLLFGIAAPLSAAEPMARVSDKDVEALVKSIEDHQKDFVRALDSKFKRSVLRGPGGEIEVAGYLDDLENDIDRFSDRFDGSYSASAEVKDLMERASMMNDYIRKHPEMDGANEWDVFGSGLQQLAGAYGTTFPLPDGAVIRRIGDGELEDTAKGISEFAKDMKKPVRKHVKGTDELKAAAKSLDDELSSLADQGDALASRIRSNKPATAEARQLVDSVGRIESLLDTPGIPEDVTTLWEEGSKSVAKVEQAFAL